jgi:hypothetical protein
MDHADFRGANLGGTNLSGADLSSSDFSRARLHASNLRTAVMKKAILCESELVEAQFIETDLSGAIIESCRVQGVSAWNVKLTSAEQSHLTITPVPGINVEVQSLEFAHLLHLLWRNESFRGLIDSTAQRGVLLLGSFSARQKNTLDLIRTYLQSHGYIGIIFDFGPSANRDLQETVMTIAGLVKFVIADITGPRSIPQELASIVPALPSVPVVPLLRTGSRPWALFEHIQRFPHVLTLGRYKDARTLSATLAQGINSAEKKCSELRASLGNSRVLFADAVRGKTKIAKR